MLTRHVPGKSTVLRRWGARQAQMADRAYDWMKFW
ncbi:Uncharacterised protein [Mycobacterium xenopi]|nr:Uncharacterised protein [Mycobacterium xenopi]